MEGWVQMGAQAKFLVLRLISLCESGPKRLLCSMLKDFEKLIIFEKTKKYIGSFSDENLFKKNILLMILEL